MKVSFQKKEKIANQTLAGAALLLNPVQFICNSSANISVPIVNEIGNQWCTKAAAVQPMANHLLIKAAKGCTPATFWEIQ